MLQTNPENKTTSFEDIQQTPAAPGAVGKLLQVLRTRHMLRRHVRRRRHRVPSATIELEF